MEELLQTRTAPSPPIAAANLAAANSGTIVIPLTEQPGDRIGLVCSEETAYQYQPEQTTSAIICHHPKAKYFVAR